MMLRAFPFLLVLALPLSAQADQAAATACAAGLSAEGKLIYAKTAPEVTPATDLREAVTAVARSMVIGGQMTREVARPAAEAAGECLKLLK
jgi:hypothetical protein